MNEWVNEWMYYVNFYVIIKHKFVQLLKTYAIYKQRKNKNNKKSRDTNTKKHRIKTKRKNNKKGQVLELQINPVAKAN